MRVHAKRYESLAMQNHCRATAVPQMNLNDEEDITRADATALRPVSCGDSNSP